MNGFITEIEQSLSANTFVKLTVSKPRMRGALQNIYVRLVAVKNKPHLSFTYHFETKDEVKNFLLTEGIAQLRQHLAQDFRNAYLFTTTKNVVLEISKKEKIKIIEQEASFQEVPQRQHDKEKRRFVSPERPYLQYLGITGKDGKVLKNWQSKYKQIDKYIEIIDGLLQTATLPAHINIVDMGSGKGYLTFALYDYLVNERGLAVTLTGIELRQHLVDFCNEVAQKVGFSALRFVAQDINDFPAAEIDVLIALHACDTATDIALAKGILSDAALIVAAPCCHKQVRREMSKANILYPVLKHGILEERQAEMITDGIRALILEDRGYATKVFEFVSNEHTNKNLMIVGVKAANGTAINATALEEVAEIKRQFGIGQHYLEGLLV
jgi:SAM-dependent methyltransferase